MLEPRAVEPDPGEDGLPGGGRSGAVAIHAVNRHSIWAPDWNRLWSRTAFEFKSDLRRERRDAESGLTRYLTEREEQTGDLR